MWTYIARRVLWAIPTLIGVSLVTFLIMAILPGDIAYNILGTAAQPEAVEALREELGLNDPVYVRYGRWLKDMATMDLGEAQVLSGRPIRELITSHFPVTLNLVINAMVLSIVFGILLGVISAVYHDTWVDHVAKIISVIGLSVPVFFLAIVITLILATAFDYQADWVYVSPFKDPWGNIEMMFWPSVTLAYYLVAFTARMTRSALLEVMFEDYMRTARAKGLRERVVVMRARSAQRDDTCRHSRGREFSCPAGRAGANRESVQLAGLGDPSVVRGVLPRRCHDPDADLHLCGRGCSCQSAHRCHVRLAGPQNPLRINRL